MAARPHGLPARSGGLAVQTAPSSTGGRPTTMMARSCPGPGSVKACPGANGGNCRLSRIEPCQTWLQPPRLGSRPFNQVCKVENLYTSTRTVALRQAPFNPLDLACSHVPEGCGILPPPGQGVYWVWGRQLLWAQMLGAVLAQMVPSRCCQSPRIRTLL